VVVDDLDIEWVAAFEAEAQPPLVVDAHAPLSATIAAQSLQMIGSWLMQIFSARGDVQVAQRTQRASQYFLREPPRRADSKQPLRFLVGQTPYHCITINKTFTAIKHAGQIYV